MMGIASHAGSTYELEHTCGPDADDSRERMPSSPWWEESGGLASLMNGFGAAYWSRDIASDRFECSESCKAIFGFDPCAVLTSFDELRAHVHPEDRSLFDERIARALERGQQYRIDHRAVGSSGQVRWLASRCGVHKKASGELVLAGVTFDITPVKEVEAERQRLFTDERRLRAVIDAMPIGVVVLDASGRIILRNAACARLLPSSVMPPVDIADAIRRWRAFHSDGRPMDVQRRPVARVLAGETVQGEDMRLIAEDGTETWVWLSGAPIRDAAGAITGAVVVGTNVDQTKQAEAALRESQSRLRQLFESPVIGIIHVSLDGPILNANDTFLRTFGYTRDDLAAGRLSWLDMTPPEYRAIDQQNVDELRTCRSARVYEKEYFRKDGVRVPIALGSTMMEGSTKECVTFILDISDRKKADRERDSLLESLALSEERYRLAAMASEDQIYDWDIRSDRVSLEAEVIKTGPITSGTSWFAFVHPDDRERAMDSLFNAITGGEQLWIEEYRLARRDGTWMNVIDRGYIARDTSGRPLRVVGAVQDVTSSRQREEFERQLIGIVSHDLKNPLNTISLAVEMMRRAVDLTEPQRKNVERIYTAARRATRLVCDLLDFAKARVGGGIQVELCTVDLAPVCESLLDEIRAQHFGGRRNIEFETSGDVKGQFDLDRLGQVVTNLVENALKYSSGDECVRVCLRGEPDAVVLSVHNYGPPISAEQQARIFEPMQRGTQGADVPAGGARSVGLGLYIVKHIVEAHGGSVDVSSSSNDGTTFVVRFPRSTRP